jgi:S1-C subfamily serine protease
VQSYRDPIGREAEVNRLVSVLPRLLSQIQVGTYDELAEMLIAGALPEPGASGGPVIDAAGSVVGIIRGYRTAWDERTTAGFASPAEAIWHVADLPGLSLRG